MGFVPAHFVAHATDLGLACMLASSAMGLMGGFSIVGVPPMGALSDQIGRRLPLGITFGWRGLGYVFLGRRGVGGRWVIIGPARLAARCHHGGPKDPEAPHAFAVTPHCWASVPRLKAALASVERSRLDIRIEIWCINTSGRRVSPATITADRGLRTFLTPRSLLMEGTRGRGHGAAD